MTLAPDAFSIEGYFEAYVKYVEDHRLALAEGRSPEMVEFNLPLIDEDGLGNEKTKSLDGEAGSPDSEGNEAAEHGGIGHDEDPDV